MTSKNACIYPSAAHLSIDRMEAGRFKQCIFFVSSKVCINILKDEGIFQKTTAGYDVLVIYFQKISRPPYGYMAIARLKPKRCNIINHPRLLIFWNWTIQNLEHDPISKDNKTTWDIPHLFQDVFFIFFPQFLSKYDLLFPS